MAAVLVDTKGQQASLPLVDITGMGAVKNIRNEPGILKTHSLAEEVARRLLEREYVDDGRTKPLLIIRSDGEGSRESGLTRVQGVMRSLGDAVEFDPDRDSDIIKIIARSNDPEEAALISNMVAQAYYDRNLSGSRMRSRAIREFLEAQLHSKKASLDAAEGNLQQYMEQKGIVSLDEEAKKVIGDGNEPTG